MKKTMKIGLFLGLFLLICSLNTGFSGLIIGSDMFFTTSMQYDGTNVVNTNGLNDWVFKSSYLFVGLYPQFTEKTIKGDARILVQGTGGAVGKENLIFLGGARVYGWTEDKTFEGAVFALAPTFTLGDPMRTGVAYSSGAYTSPIASMTHFYNTNLYPAVFDSKWMNGWDYELGGNQAVGYFARLNFLNNMLSLENFFAYHLNNFDSVGAVLKLNALKIAVVNLSAGVVVDSLRYKSAQNFHTTYNHNYFFDMTRRLPTQSSLNEDNYFAYGGFVSAEIMKMVTVFAEFKLNQANARTANVNATNALNGSILYAGALFTLPGIFAEVDFGTSSQITNTNCGTNAFRNAMEIKAKVGVNMTLLKSLSMNLGLVLEGTYITANDTLRGYSFFENVALGSLHTNISGMELKTSLKFDVLNMISLRELFRYANVSLNRDTKTTINFMESRTYVDVNLSRFVQGLGVTGGVRLSSYSIDNSALAVNGTASYMTPYFELRYFFGKDNDSFIRFSYGESENYSSLLNAYGYDLDSQKFYSSFSMDSASKLYNNVDYNRANTPRFNLDFGFRL